MFAPLTGFESFPSSQCGLYGRIFLERILVLSPFFQEKWAAINSYYLIEAVIVAEVYG